jgi:hypothetical protein
MSMRRATAGNCFPRAANPTVMLLKMARAPSGLWPPLRTDMNKLWRIMWNIPITCMSGEGTLIARKASIEPKNSHAALEKVALTASATEGHVTKCLMLALAARPQKAHGRCAPNRPGVAQASDADLIKSPAAESGRHDAKPRTRSSSRFACTRVAPGSMRRSLTNRSCEARARQEISSSLKTAVWTDLGFF